MIVVQEDSLRGVTFVRHAVLLGHLLEGRHAILVQSLVDPELIRALLGRARPGAANVDVEKAVAIDIGDGDSRRPRPTLRRDSRFARDVAKSKVTLIQIEPRSALIGREEDVR